MSLSLNLTLPKKENKEEITQEILRQHLPQLRYIISYWRLYPDKFIDYMCSLNPDNTFSLYSYQRMFLRALFRHRYVYGVFVRGWSKSFMCVLALIVKAILYPGAQLFTAAGGKK